MPSLQIELMVERAVTALGTPAGFLLLSSIACLNVSPALLSNWVPSLYR